MATLTVTKSYADGEILFEADLDAVKESIETFVNTTKLNDDNIQDSGISSAKLADGAVTAAKLATDSVTTAKLANDAVTADKLKDSASTDADRAVTTNHIRDSAVTTAKINDAAVTFAKLAARTTGTSVAAGGVAISDSSTTFSTSSTTYVDVTNLSVTITTLGRPVHLMLVPDTSTNGSCIQVERASAVVNAKLKLLRDADEVTVMNFGGIMDTSGTENTISFTDPPGAFFTIDSPAAGTYTYKIQGLTNAGSTTLEVLYSRLVAWEV